MDMMSLVAGGTLGLADDAFKLYQQRRGEAFQEQFAKEGLRWRVADAEAAGLSPVYGAGLGGAVGSAIPIMSSSLGEMGQNISRAALASSTPEERENVLLKSKALEAEIRRSDAQTEGVNLQNLKLLRELQAQPALPSLFDGGGSGSHGKVVVREDEMGRFPGLRGAVEAFAPKVASSSLEHSSVMAGNNPAWQKFELADGTTVMLPYAGEGQTFFGNSPFAGAILALPQYADKQIRRGNYFPYWLADKAKGWWKSVDEWGHGKSLGKWRPGAR